MDREAVVTDKTEFQKTEGKLYSYYRAMARKNRIIDRLNRTEIKISQVKRDLADIHLDTPAMTANYSGMNVTGGEESSYVERAFAEIEDRLLRELQQLKERKIKLRQKIRDIDSQWEGIQYIIDNYLSDEERFVAEQKYMFGLSLRQIGHAYQKEYHEIKHNTTINEWREKIVKKVAEELKYVPAKSLQIPSTQGQKAVI